jgi:hypothetical protein
LPPTLEPGGSPLSEAERTVQRWKCDMDQARAFADAARWQEARIPRGPEYEYENLR